MKSYKKLKLRF